MARLEAIIAHGNRGHDGSGASWITCADGFKMSVIAGGGARCDPQPALCSCSIASDDGPAWLQQEPGGARHDYPGPYSAVEVGFPSARPEPWDQWSGYQEDADDPTLTVYNRVPVRMVRALVASHGGEAA